MLYGVVSSASAGLLDVATSAAALPINSHLRACFLQMLRRGGRRHRSRRLRPAAQRTATFRTLTTTGGRRREAAAELCRGWAVQCGQELCTLLLRQGCPDATATSHHPTASAATQTCLQHGQRYPESAAGGGTAEGFWRGRGGGTGSTRCQAGSSGTGGRSAALCIRCLYVGGRPARLS